MLKHVNKVDPSEKRVLNWPTSFPALFHE